MLISSFYWAGVCYDRRCPSWSGGCWRGIDDGIGDGGMEVSGCGERVVWPKMNKSDGDLGCSCIQNIFVGTNIKSHKPLLNLVNDGEKFEKRIFLEKGGIIK